MRDQRAPEALLEEARGHRHPAGKPGQPLAEPRPREPVRIAEIDRAPDRAPEPRADEEAHLPVVDVEDERPFSCDPLQVPDAGAPKLRLGRVDEIAVGAPGEIAHGGEECRHPPEWDARVANGSGGDRLPDIRL